MVIFYLIKKIKNSEWANSGGGAGGGVIMILKGVG